MREFKSDFILCDTDFIYTFPRQKKDIQIKRKSVNQLGILGQC